MPPLTIGDARKVYERKVIPRTGFNKFQKQVLRELCEEQGVSVTSTAVWSSDPTKEDFIRDLLANVGSLAFTESVLNKKGIRSEKRERKTVN